jgi:hypothetical protein
MSVVAWGGFVSVVLCFFGFFRVRVKAIACLNPSAELSHALEQNLTSESCEKDVGAHIA